MAFSFVLVCKLLHNEIIVLLFLMFFYLSLNFSIFEFCSLCEVLILFDLKSTIHNSRFSAIFKLLNILQNLTFKRKPRSRKRKKRRGKERGGVKGRKRKEEKRKIKKKK